MSDGREERVERAKRTWSIVLQYPCTSSVCDNVCGQLCSNGRGNERLQPHKQRIAAAVAAGACDSYGKPVGAAKYGFPSEQDAEARATEEIERGAAQAGTGNAEGSRMEALDDMTDPARDPPAPRWHAPQVNADNPNVAQLLPPAPIDIYADLKAEKLQLAKKARSDAIAALHEYKRTLGNAGVQPAAIERVENALRALGVA